MTATLTDPIRREAVLPQGRTPPGGATRGVRILAAVDGSAGSGRVVQYLIELAAERGPIDVVLLNVQPQPEEGRLRGYGSFKRAEIHDRLINDRGRRTVASAGRRLDGAGIAHSDRIEIGDLAATVVRCAREERCDLIVLAERPPGALRRWLLRSARLSIGSTAGVVVQLADLPVLAVK